MTPVALDIIIAVILIISALLACLRGFIKEVFSMIALIGATYLSWKSSHLLVPQFNDWFGVTPDKAENVASAASAEGREDLVMGILSPELAATVSAYGTVFLGFFIVMSLIGFFLSRIINEVGMGPVDRILGGGFGLARGFMIVFALYLGGSYLIDYKKFPEWAEKSTFVPVLEQARLWTDRNFGLEQKLIEDRGDDVAIKIGKFSLEDETDPSILNAIMPAAGEPQSGNSAQKPVTQGLRQDEVTQTPPAFYGE